MSNVVASSHPLVQHKLASLRDVRTQPADFRRAVRTLAVLLAQDPATVNQRRFWKGLSWHVIGLDRDARCRPDVVGDNRALPFQDQCFDAVVYDPPHIPNQGRDRTKDFNDRFGLVLKSPATNGYNFTHLYPPFLREAFRVLKPEGVLFCKIADYIHNHRYQWANLDVVRAAV